MEFSKFTDNAINAMSCAQKAAADLGHGYVGSEHLLLGVIKCADKTSALLSRFGVSESNALPFIDSPAGALRNRFIDSYGNTQSVKRILELALYEAKSCGSELIDTEHIILSIMRERDCMGSRLIDTLCTSKYSLREGLLGHPVSESEDTPDADEAALDDTMWLNCTLNTDEDDPASAAAALPKPGIHKRQDRSIEICAADTPVINSFSRDLSELAVNEELDPVIGRESEIDRVMLTLCRRLKNNPVLIGEPGVGKSAVVEGLAQRIAEGNVPRQLMGSRVLSLDLGAMIAGTKYRGEFEERLNAAVDELKNDPKAILFIDEIHTIVGAGAGEGSIDAANILKPALARGELRVIGATTIEEYRQYIEKDAALERRFSPILINEPDPEQTLILLKGLMPRYEKHHNAKITDEAIEAAVELSVKYMADRRLPDKAIDLLDEAAAFVQLKKEASAANTKDNASDPSRIRKLMEQAAEQGDYDTAETLRQKLLSAEEQNETPAVHRLVTAEDVEQVAAERTGLDIKAMRSGFDKLEQKLNEAVFGQQSAVAELSAVLRKSAAGLSYPEKPLGVFCFAGPEGCGRETLAVRLADELFGGSVVRLNGMEYSDEGAAFRLIGSPNGYRDSEKGGALTEHVKRRPFTVVLCRNCRSFADEAVNILARIASEGVIEDGRGRKVSFRSCVMIFIADIEEDRRLGFESSSCSRTCHSESSVLRALPDSLLLSLDASLVFDKLSSSSLEQIAERELNGLAERASKKGITLEFAEGTARSLADSSGMSAANIKRLVSTGPEDALSIALLDRSVTSGDRVICRFDNGKYLIERQ